MDRQQPSACADRNLIFDLGMHLALDTYFYLSKGFKVVALEANPALVAKGHQSLAGFLASGDLVIAEKALWATGGGEISFFINPVKDDWSSAFQGWAEKEGHRAEEIKVGTVTLSDMFDTYGVPYYIKCDIEGADEIFVAQLLADSRRPAFVSIEAVSLDALALLRACGYDRFQITNQAFNGYVSCPEPPREGRHVATQFNGHMSGLFGHELEPRKWLPFATVAESYLAFMRLGERDEQLAHGWLDFHATSQAFVPGLAA